MFYEEKSRKSIQQISLLSYFEIVIAITFYNRHLVSVAINIKARLFKQKITSHWSAQIIVKFFSNKVF